MKRILILKDDYNSFEQYYIDQLNKNGIKTEYYYSNHYRWRKAWTHFGFPFESLWYNDWKKEIKKYDIIIVFDSIHTKKIIKNVYDMKRDDARIIFWHWNPIKTSKEIKLLDSTINWCEHWSFNSNDCLKHDMKKNNQFYFFQDDLCLAPDNTVFFIGVDKGRYDKILEIKSIIENTGFDTDFHIIVNDIERYNNDSLCETQFMDYNEVITHINHSKVLLEIVQDGQNGMTSRALEALFFKRKLITNNASIKNERFYNKNNVFLIGEDLIEGLGGFLMSDYSEIDNSLLLDYSVDGWIKCFEDNN